MKNKTSKKTEYEEALRKAKLEAEKEDKWDDKDFDFGGLPKNVPLKKNLGCGG